ncbi:hypothetical protein V491_04946 [Pseudogymnoascus sp. VKM F-3775]|nr:hypothetical protein V491_04946 [Pseudogymnoascus sp. VKM F-3775]
MDMYPWPWAPRFFCCLPGLVAIVPYTGDGGLCLPVDQNVPSSEILTATEQVGVGLSRTSVPVVSATNPPTSGTITNYTPSILTSSSTSCTSDSCSTKHPTGADKVSSSNSNDGLSNSAIGGIAGACVVLALIISYFCIKRRRNRKRMNVPSRIEVFQSIAPHLANPMYVSTGQPYFTHLPAGSTETPSTPAPHESTNTQSPVPATAVSVSPLSARVSSPPPPYGSSPAAQYGELHGQAGELFLFVWVGEGLSKDGCAGGARVDGGGDARER